MNTVRTHIPKFQKLTSCVTRILGCNPGHMTLQGTNTYLIGTGPRKLLIDAGEENNSEYLSLLQSTLKETNSYISEIIVTHWHHDHVGGVPDVFKMLLNQEGSVAEPKVSKFPRMKAPEFSLGNIPYNFIKDQHVFTTDGATLRAYYTPGHSEDHLVLFLEEENSLFSGDTVLGEGTTVMEDLSDYMKSLEVILNLNPKLIYPGHGPLVEEPVEYVKNYIKHRELRESQIISSLKESLPKSLNLSEIRTHVYKDLNESLHTAAEKNLVLHLDKLVKENIVETYEENAAQKWRLLNRPSL